MKKRLFNPRGRQIEIASSRESYLVLNDNYYAWNPEAEFYAAFGSLIDSPAHYIVAFEAENPYVLKITMIWYNTRLELFRIINGVNKTAKEGEFKEVWVDYSVAICDSKPMEFDKFLTLLLQIKLPNIHYEGDIIKWDI